MLVSGFRLLLSWRLCSSSVLITDITFLHHRGSHNLLDQLDLLQQTRTLFKTVLIMRHQLIILSIFHVQFLESQYHMFLGLWPEYCTLIKKKKEKREKPAFTFLMS